MSETKIVKLDSGKSLDLAGSVYLEDFYHKPELQQHELEVLKLSVSFQNGPPKSICEFYKIAAEHLRYAAPNLKSVVLDGGYVFNPSDDTSAVFENEINELKVHFQTIVNNLQETGLPLERVRFVSIYTFHVSSIQTAQEVFKNVFNVDLTDRDVEENVVYFTYHSNGVKFDVKIQLSITLLKASEKDRSRFYDAEVTTQF
ncbi:unnamed protein product [Bursaphelenchus okinawaensis]|uniref:Uncharacterized protein n=1 Tax=Bursaphelenchus okinawaensis TaxID=465554 RepID=A0A811JWM4_9BILA|nr:unnamed protein product [Bursaphelenchus okinawaensis]CAG9086879.1 unnamed protein product [Bursaphelenchus okinawaensis]